MHGGVRKLSEQQTPVAEAIQAAGYSTAGFHSNPHLLPQFGYGRGFDTFFGSDSEPSQLARLRQWVKDTLDQDGLVYSILERSFAASEQKIGFNPGTPFVPADELTDRAIDRCREMTEGPRFLWIHYMDVHHPYLPPDEHQLAFREDLISERRAVKLRRKMLESPESITDQELTDLIDLYDGEIRFFDTEVQRLVEEIRAEWDSEPLIAFTSDHGDEFLDHSQFSHYKTLYDELLHVPVFVNDGESSSSHEDVVELIDLPPTILEYADVDVPDSYEGTSLRTVIEGNEKKKQYAICDGEDTYSYRDDRWKLIERPDDVELYDIRTDPDEQENVSQDHPDVVEELAAIIDSYRQKADQTDEQLDSVAIDGEVQDRLEQLGYMQE
jgi:arylsulfatase A-like enzyme